MRRGRGRPTLHNLVYGRLKGVQQSLRLPRTQVPPRTAMRTISVESDA